MNMGERRDEGSKFGWDVLYERILENIKMHLLKGK